MQLVIRINTMHGRTQQLHSVGTIKAINACKYMYKFPIRSLIERTYNVSDPLPCYTMYVFFAIKEYDARARWCFLCCIDTCSYFLRKYCFPSSHWRWRFNNVFALGICVNLTRIANVYHAKELLERKKCVRMEKLLSNVGIRYLYLRI